MEESIARNFWENVLLKWPTSSKEKIRYLKFNLQLMVNFNYRKGSLIFLLKYVYIWVFSKSKLSKLHQINYTSMKTKSLLVLFLIFGFSLHAREIEATESRPLSEISKKNTSNPIEGIWKVIEFTYMKAGTKNPLTLGRSDFEDMIKYKATYQFDKINGVIFTIGSYNQNYSYAISNNRLTITKRGSSEILNTYTFTLLSGKLTLTENTNSYDLTLTLEKLN